jgi:aconitate hydratase
MEISSALIGSCTNSSYEDISRAAAIARFAHENGLSTKTPLLVTPGSEQVRATIERDGLLADLEQIGATVLANACGPCIGQWSRSDVEEGTENIIVTSYNRNFPKRNDGLASTLAFVTSPETVVALALAGRVDFDPTADSLTNAAGDQVTIPVPTGVELPPKGFTAGENTFIAPPADSSNVVVKVSPTSDRLQLLEPFDPWDGNDFLNLPILMKAKGKCTTDHISAAGPWLKYRGHLENISGNMFIGAVNAFTDEVGMGKDQLDGTTKSFPDIGKHYHEAGQGWIAIGDENYGEGSSREHAAMEPRFRGAKVVLTRSFARIHETNLKKQGVLPLVFADPKVYDLIEQDDRINVLGLADLTPDVPVKCQIVKPDGSTIDFDGIHTMNDEQIDWFKAGGALNIIRQRQGV